MLLISISGGKKLPCKKLNSVPPPANRRSPLCVIGYENLTRRTAMPTFEVVRGFFFEGAEPKYYTRKERHNTRTVLTLHARPPLRSYHAHSSRTDSEPHLDFRGTNESNCGESTAVSLLLRGIYEHHVCRATTSVGCGESDPTYSVFRLFLSCGTCRGGGCVWGGV